MTSSSGADESATTRAIVWRAQTSQALRSRSLDTYTIHIERKQEQGRAPVESRRGLSHCEPSIALKPEPGRPHAREKVQNSHLLFA